MLAQLATVRARLALVAGDTTYDDLLTRAIEAVSARFDRECNRTFARTAGATQEFGATETEIVARCYQESLRGVVAEQSAANAKLIVCLDNNTKVLEEYRDELRFVRKERK